MINKKKGNHFQYGMNKKWHFKQFGYTHTHTQWNNLTKWIHVVIIIAILIIDE